MVCLYTVLSYTTLRDTTRVQDAICSLCVLWWHTEALVEAGEEVSEHTVSVIDGDRARESQFGYEPVLEGAGHTLNPPLGLRRASEYQLYAKLVHRATELSGRSGSF